MVKNHLKWLIIVIVLLFSQSAKADDEIDYSIISYEGALQIHEDNTATFEQVITYDYDSSFNGQYVSLGLAGNVPEHFDIASKPLVHVEKNNQVIADAETILEPLSDGYRLKIYNAGISGDLVEISVTWKLVNIIFPYQDVAELNWKPISDWDETIDRVTFTVTTDKPTKISNIWGHRGYFKTPPKKYWDGNGRYTLEAHDVDDVLELHGYWDSNILNLSVPRLSEKALPRIEKTEQKIEKKSQLLLVIFGRVVPIAIACLTGISLWRFAKVKKGLDRYRSKIGKTRLYEVPEDLSPLLLANDVYQVTFKDIVKSPEEGEFHFEHVVQAMILDLIDRGIVSVDKETSVPTLSIVNLDHCTSSDVAFLDMAFGNRLSVTLDKLFDDFQYDSTIMKRLKKQYSGSQLETEVRKSSQKMAHRIRAMSSAIDKAVTKELATLHLPKIYRPMTSQESKKLHEASGLGCFFSLITFGLTIYFVMKVHMLALLYLLITVVSFGLIFLLGRLTKPYTTLGVITEEGMVRLEKWQSFERMIKEFNTFNAVELEGLVLWNRLLVYATLFGYASKIEHYLNVNHIALPEQFGNIDIGLIRHQMILSTNHFVSTSNHVTTASNFSVSSGGRSGGGGFSGGGGGGGGGSF
ncbi:DUF2207 domain-containing protein [Streptococcus sp. S784/96/1]|uniref:DUF2207 domain-containing protein n=1 Tax=Streptococcus sp. S784/96/1 TaxID=2653499 RepID=UPI001389E89D|nr:DUF2207 domain-containing protein [Streptococcus sp. S784/96/1]